MSVRTVALLTVQVRAFFRQQWQSRAFEDIGLRTSTRFEDMDTLELWLVWQPAQSVPSAVPRLGSRAASGRAWRLRAAWHSQEEVGPLGAQPLPRVLSSAPPPNEKKPPISPHWTAQTWACAVGIPVVNTVAFVLGAGPLLRHEQVEAFLALP